MSYPRRASFSEFQRGQTGRARGGSDATLVEYQPSEKKGYDQSTYPRTVSSKLYEDQPAHPQSDYRQRRESNANGAQRVSCMKQNSRPYYPDGQSVGQPRNPQQRRSVHFQFDDDYIKSMQQPQWSNKGAPHEYEYDYGFVQDEDERDKQYMHPEAQSRRYSNFDDSRLPGLPQPVTAPQHSAGATPDAPYGFVLMPQKEKKPRMVTKIKDAFVSVSTNPDYIALGCKPGHPTPLDILYKEEEEEAAVHAKRAAELKKREEEATLCKLKKLAKYNARANERVAEGGRSHVQGKSKSDKNVKPSAKAFSSRRGQKYSAWLAEEYARQNTKMHEYDSEKKRPSKPSNPSEATAYSSYRRNQGEADRVRRLYIAQELRKLAPVYDSMTGEEREGIDRLFRPAQGHALKEQS